MKQNICQKQYFENNKHQYLSFVADDHYARNLVRHVKAVGKIGPRDKVLEIGSGEGRFSLHMAKAGADLTCVDISERLKEKFFDNARQRGIAFERSNFHCVAIEDFLQQEGGQQFDAIIGFFILHHLEHQDLAAIFSGFKRILKPGGRICFLEPNRLNPLYFFQITLLPSFEFKEELGMYKLSPALFRKILSRSGFKNIHYENFGCFPPHVVNRYPSLIGLECGLERVPLVKSLLPFLVVTAHA